MSKETKPPFWAFGPLKRLWEENARLHEDNMRMYREAQESFQNFQERRRQFRDGTWEGCTTKDYMDSVFDSDNCDEGFFSLKYQWEDKPHRHVADLCDWVNALQDEVKRFRNDKT